MNCRALRAAIGCGLVATGWIGCRPGPLPEELYREGESLRIQYEKEAAEAAAARFAAAATEWSSRKDFRQAAKARCRIGMAYWQLGRLDAALRAYEAALADARASGDRPLESEALSDVGIGQAYVAEQERDFDAAFRTCESSLALAREIRAGPPEAKALMCLAEAAYAHGERERALELYLRAGESFARLGDQRGEAESLLNQGMVYSDQSDFGRAGDRLARARQAWAALGDSRGGALTLLAVSKLQQRRGEFQAALNGLSETLTHMQRMGDVVWEGATLAAFGSVYLQMGQIDHALTYWERGLERYEAAGLRSFRVDLLISLGEAYLASGDDVRALDRFERALGLGRALADDHWQAYALRSIGAVHLHRADHGMAVTFLERSLAVQARIRNPRFEAETRADLGEAWRLSGELRRARTSFQTAVSLSREAEFLLGEARGLDGLARVALQLNDLDVARRHVEGALAIVESLRGALASSDLRASYMASVYRYHETHMDVLMRLDAAQPGRGYSAAAFEASEQARGRALLEGLAEAGVDLRRDIAPALVEREQALKRDFDAWAARQRQALGALPAPAAERRLSREYQELESRHTALDAELRSRSPRYAALVRPLPLTLRQVQHSVLDNDTILLEYALGERASYLWAVSRTGHSVHRLPPRAEINRAAQSLHGHLTARLRLRGSYGDRRRQAEESDFLYWEQARHLSDLLLGPVATSIAGKRIAVVPDGALHFVPFAALPVPGSLPAAVPLVADHEVVTLPSASSLAVLRQQTTGRRAPAGAVAILADPIFELDDPRLRAALRAAGGNRSIPVASTTDPRPSGAPHAGPARPALRLSRLAATRLEADAIRTAASGAGVVTRLGFEASRSAALSPELGRYRILHFATHGVFDTESPGMSGIMLSMFDGQGRPQDGFLRLHDIYGLRLPAELVVLSACSTALGKHVSGEGLVGIVRGFMFAGAKRVVASLWKVDDEATSALMGELYAGMLREGHSPAAALRAAQLAVRRQPRWESPFYWAAFSLQGEWKASDGR